MIITKTPVRISFFGGGSDLPQYYNKKPGMVISTTIDRYIKIVVNQCEPDHVRVIYSKLEQVNEVNDLQHSRVKSILKHFNIHSNIEICSFSDISTNGSGLGSSSSYTVGLINALYNLKGIDYTVHKLAAEACDIELKTLDEVLGKQDQYAVAYGGFNVIRFATSGEVALYSPLDYGGYTWRNLNRNLMFYFTGLSRSTSSILSDQVNNINDNQIMFDNTTKLVDMAETALKYLQQNKLDDFGSLLGEGWNIKKSLSSKISNPIIDEMYDTAIKSGALGGKLLGAGGGGYLMFYVPAKFQNKVAEAMSQYKRINFNFTSAGSVVQSF